jgi:putative ABC transport system substrate-binding protein
MERRRFLGVVTGGAIAGWPVLTQAQQIDRPKRVAVLMNVAADNPVGQLRLAALHQGLEKRGWSLGQNLRMEHRWGANDPQRRTYAAEIVATAPDVIVAGAASVLEPLQQATRTIPIVFLQVTDPVGAGFVASLANPGGNTTGFSLFEFAVSGKWLELLKEIAPNVRRVGVLRDRTLPAAVAQFATLQSAASSLGVELVPFGRLDKGGIEQDIAQFGKQPNHALILTVGSAGTAQSKLIVDLSARHRLPTVYPFGFHVKNGGLVSYGPDTVEMFRRGAEYVDRILKGEKPFDLPVQQPTKYELLLNLKTAKALGLTVPPALLARADEVIEIAAQSQHWRSADMTARPLHFGSWDKKSCPMRKIALQ